MFKDYLYFVVHKYVFTEWENFQVKLWRKKVIFNPLIGLLLSPLLVLSKLYPPVSSHSLCTIVAALPETERVIEM